MVHSFQKRKLDSFDKELLGLLKENENPNADEYDLFGKMVSKKLRLIAEKKRKLFLQLQQSILNNIMDVEIEIED